MSEYGADPKNFSCQLEQDLYNSEEENKKLKEALKWALDQIGCRDGEWDHEKEEAYRKEFDLC